jgi:hypothetical protein
LSVTQGTHADLTAHTLGEKRLPGPDRAADEISHRQAVERAPFQQRRILAQPGLGRGMADDRVQRPLRLDELEQAAALPLDQPLLERPEHRRVQPAAAFAGRLHQDVEIGQRDAGGEAGQIRGVEVREGGERGGIDSRLDEAQARRFVRQRHLDGRDVRVAGKPFAELRELLIEHHERHVEPFDVRAHRPVQHHHQL